MRKDTYKFKNKKVEIKIDTVEIKDNRLLLRSIYRHNGYTYENKSSIGLRRKKTWKDL